MLLLQLRENSTYDIVKYRYLLEYRRNSFYFALFFCLYLLPFAFKDIVSFFTLPVKRQTNLKKIKKKMRESERKKRDAHVRLRAKEGGRGAARD